VRAVEGAVAHEQDLVEAERGDRAKAAGVIHEHPAIGEHRVVHGMPVATELTRHLVNGSRAAPYLLSDPTTGTIGDRATRRGDARVLLAPAAVRAVHLGAAPAALVPGETRRLAETGEIDEGHDPLVPS